MRYDQSLFMSVIDSMEHLVLIVNPDGVLSALNNVAADFLPDGKNSVGQPVWLLSGWGNTAAAEKAWRHACQIAVQGPRVKFIEAINVSGKDSSLINFSVSPIKDNSGDVICLLVEGKNNSATPARFAVDDSDSSRLPGYISTIIQSAAAEADVRTRTNVTSAVVDVMKADQEFNAWLLDSENRYRLMVESIEDYAMFMVDLDGFITSWNRGAERLTGYSDLEAIGRHFSMLYPKDALDKDHAIHELMMAQAHGRYEDEGIRVRKNGSHYHAQIIVWRIDNNEGNTVGYAKITRDVTALKEAERALKESEAKFRIMTDAMPQMVWSALPNGRQDYINQQWFHFTGVDESTNAGRDWLALVHPDDKSLVGEIWQHSIASGENFEGQFRLLHTSGTYRWALGRALPVKNEQGKIIRWMGTLTDIHEQKRAETTLYESAQKKDEYLAMLAHELRNPLAPIRNSTELLRRLCKTESNVINGLDVIERQVVHMTRLIDDLLDVARISRGKIELRRENFELGELVHHTAHDFKTAYENKSIRLHISVPVKPVLIYADRTRIAQAIGNLLHNALKFTEAHGDVSIALTEECHNKKPFAIVKVKDTGAGIAPELLDQLFEPFVQGDQDLARTKGGLGLGLALIKGFANLHGGAVRVNSSGPGYGSEFIFQIPVSAGVTAGRPAAVEGAITMPLRIVLIDDNRDMVETLAALLALDGHSVKCAYDGESGLDLIKAERPDLVFCDIGLPGERDGYAVARGVREDPAIDKLFMVALSGYGQEKDKKLARECGFDDHLLKPVDLNSLTAMINAAGRSVQRTL